MAILLVQVLANSLYAIRLLMQFLPKRQTPANLIKGQTEPLKVLCSLLHYWLSLLSLCKESPGAWMFHGHPAACFPLLRFSHSLPSPRKLQLRCQLHSLTLCYRHHQPLAAERRHIRQLFCLDDSIIPFSGISITIIILIIVFDPKNCQTSLKLMNISMSAVDSSALKQVWMHFKRSQLGRLREEINW